MRNSPATPRWENKEGEELLQALKQKFPCQPWKGHIGADIHPQPVQRGPLLRTGLPWRTAVGGDDSC